MTTKLQVLRKQNERSRFGRLGIDDARTAPEHDVVESLSIALKQSIDGEVRFDKGARAPLCHRRLELPAGPDRRGDSAA